MNPVSSHFAKAKGQKPRSLGAARPAQTANRRRATEQIHGVVAGYQVRSPLWAGFSACQGVFAGYTMDLQHLSIAPRAGFCRNSRTGSFVKDTADDVSLEVRLSHAWDLPVVTLELGVAGGSALLHRSFATTGVAPDRTSLAFNLSAWGGASVEVARGLYLSVTADGSTYFFREESSSTGRVALATAFAVTASVGLGKRF